MEELTKKLSEIKKQKETSESQLSEMSKRKETAESKCSELEATNVSLTREDEQARALKKSLQDARVDLISAGDESFERSKAQALCIMLDLNVSKMYFFQGCGGQAVGRHGGSFP